jgi:hypothetical protein
MRSLEVHVFETERDIDLALGGGIVLPEQLASSRCIECSDGIGYSSGPVFGSFVLVIDENDQDWLLCHECASPILSYVDAYFPPVVKSHYLRDDHGIDLDDLETF